MHLRPWVVWATGVAAYTIAVLHRSSIGVAGLDAQERFGVGAGALAVFAVLQLLVYAVLQIPIGLLLDRFGSMRLVVAGGLLMVAGQTLMAFTDGMGGAITARVLVGAGDAMTFVSVLRLVPHWFPARQVPVMSQITGIMGQAGQILAAVPLAAVLAGPGWSAGFLGAAAVGVLVTIVVVAALRDTPESRINNGDSMSWSRLGTDLGSSWRHPGTRLGLWAHFTTQFTGTVFALMWGVPFLVAGEGLSRETAGVLLTVFVVTGMAAGPILGLLTQRHPLRRSWMVLGIVGINMTAWAAVIAWPGRAPLWLLVVLVVALGLGGPASMIGFDFARTFNPPSRLGTATGVVNVGGFTASLVTIQLIGLILDYRTGGGNDYHIDDFRIAMSVQFVVAAAGVVGILRTRRLTRRHVAAESAGLAFPLEVKAP
ncbi:MFS transporter [Actinoplanes derwentensis]|uniref:Sugar phosphate permease n=1 Tax=Actinoplanes derwentensis TaxID=113562 RepID=A0A1H2D7C3_9ACTN|nr:MFS transporter [Actinoplanes derwentensis]GID86302.1 MFS transporter [Actinoplanes derwentensis]SDT78655.1 Sugar phosphate permease [Actinoplanes derwentensis]